MNSDSLLVFLFLTISLTRGIAQSVDYDNLGDIPAFSMYGDNYLLTGTSLTDDPFSRSSSDIKFQIGFKHRLVNRSLPLGTHLFLTYQQRSFWDFFQKSAPFRETNYNPGISLGRTFIRNGNLLGVLYLELEHESNGRNGDASRSWNRLTLNSKWCPHPKFRVDISAWWPFDIDEATNEDLVQYTGYQKVGFSWNFSPRFFLDVDSQLAFEEEMRGNLNVGLYFQHSQSQDRFIYIQLFHGYAEELFAYRDRRTMLRLGVAFRHAFFNVD